MPLLHSAFSMFTGAITTDTTNATHAHNNYVNSTCTVHITHCQGSNCIDACGTHAMCELVMILDYSPVSKSYNTVAVS